MARTLTPASPVSDLGGIAGACVRLLDRLVAADRRGHGERFQLRFIAGGSLLGLLVAIGSVINEAVVGNSLGGIPVFGVYLLGVLVACRVGVRMPLLVWATLIGLTAFLFLQSLVTVELQPQQLAWLVLIPQVSLALVSPISSNQEIASRSPVVTGSMLAFVVGIAIVVAHHFGITFDRPYTPAAAPYYLFDFTALLGSVTGMMWLYDLTRRSAERELQALRQLLSICAWCKDIRDQEQGWVSLEKYMARHQTPALSHGICPSCIARHFPDEPDDEPPGS